MGVVTILWGNNIVENQLECTQDPTVPLNNTSLHFSGIIKALELTPIDEPLKIITINNTIANFFNKPSKYKRAANDSPYLKQMKPLVKRVKELINTRRIKPKVIHAGSDLIKLQHCNQAKNIAASKFQEYKTNYIQEQQELLKRRLQRDIYAPQKSTQLSNPSTNNHVTGSSSLTQLSTGSHPIPVNELRKSSASSSQLIQPPVNRLKKRKEHDSDAYLHLSRKSRRLVKKYKSLIDDNSIMDNGSSVSEKEEEEEARLDNPVHQRQAVTNSEDEDDDEFVDATEEFIHDNQNNDMTNQSYYVPTWIKSVYSSFKNSFNR
ncbi:hypothetical protein BDC45DRAFT_134058 [Circinella umbellata]|nr:hypothetical protein BDC45DRAFT_134058 [Circinella umbellata]